MYKIYLISGIQKQLYQYGITLEDVVEPYLLQIGFLERTPR